MTSNGIPEAPDRPGYLTFLAQGGAVTGYFALKVLIGFALVTTSAQRLSISEFVTFSQLFLYIALLATVAAGGVQGGLTREVAAAGDDLPKERRVVAAAMSIWLSALALLVSAAFLLRYQLSVLLVGDNAVAGLIPIVTMAAMAGGGGAIATSVMTGRGRLPLAIGLQGVGLAIGGGLCLWRLIERDVPGAVLGYAAGPIVTAALAMPLTRRWLPHSLTDFSGAPAEVRLLLRFSGAALVASVIMPVTLFALRYLLRAEVGEEALGYWLTANRVSDITSQLLGLYMGQLFLPQAARSTAPEATRRLLRHTLWIGSAIMVFGFLLFLLGSDFWVRTFLSEQFVPAIPFIAGYLFGDVLRVSASMALHFFVARRRLRAYLGVEALTAGLLFITMAALVALGRPDAPYLAYMLTYGVMIAIAWPWMLRTARGS